MCTSKGRAKDVLVIFNLQEKKNLNSFDKNCTQENARFHTQHEKC